MFIAERTWIDPFKITFIISDTNPSAPNYPQTQSSFPGYGVAIIVVCILLILAVPLVIVLVSSDMCCVGRIGIYVWQLIYLWW